MSGSPWFTSCCFALYGHISVRELYLACPNWLSCTLCLIFFKNVSGWGKPKKISLDVNFSGFWNRQNYMYIYYIQKQWILLILQHQSKNAVTITPDTFTPLWIPLLLCTTSWNSNWGQNGYKNKVWRIIFMLRSFQIHLTVFFTFEGLNFLSCVLCRWIKLYRFYCGLAFPSIFLYLSNIQAS